MRTLLVAICWVVGGVLTWAQLEGQQEAQKAQVPEAPQSVTPGDTNTGQAPVRTKGTVLFERHVEAVDPEAKPVEEKKVEPEAAKGGAVAGPAEADVQVSDVERGALTFLMYDLDAHLTPAKAGLEMHARVRVRNDGRAALTKVALQISSSLQWERFTVAGGDAVFVQHLVDTDADHTGQAREAIVTLREPLGVGKIVELSAIYSGTVERSARRLEAMGAPLPQAAAADWDHIAVEGTALRGYGNVLWYPVASAQVFLGDGATLFRAVGETKRRQAGATMQLRLTIEYVGDAPRAAYFCGRMERLTAVSEDIDAPLARAPGVATAVFAERVLGFRVPSLFLPESEAKGLDGGLLAVVSDDDAAAARYARGAALVQPLMVDWLGESPQRALTVVRHGGQRFEDGAMLVGPMDEADAGAVARELAHSLSHAWFRSSQAWLDEGVAQLMSYLWLEREQGREVAMEQIAGQTVPLALVEPAAGAASGSGQSLIEARDEVYYRTKAAAVLWMLRSVVGDEVLKQALQVYGREARRDARLDAGRDDDPQEFERVVEEAAKKDLRWFFDDWVYRDRGLPELSIASVNPRELTGKDGRGGWLIAVEVKNAGDAGVEVPVTVRSGTLTQTVRLKVLGRSSASTRIVFEGDPKEVSVNDGSVPEVGAGVHVRQLRGR